LTGAPIEVAEAEHCYRCARCGVWVDRRDLGMVFDHEGKLLHSAVDRPQ
jgi:Zn-finger nucleic acid-binding protein